MMYQHFDQMVVVRRSFQDMSSRAQQVLLILNFQMMSVKMMKFPLLLSFLYEYLLDLMMYLIGKNLDMPILLFGALLFQNFLLLLFLAHL